MSIHSNVQMSAVDSITSCSRNTRWLPTCRQSRRGNGPSASCKRYSPNDGLLNFRDTAAVRKAFWHQSWRRMSTVQRPVMRGAAPCVDPTCVSPKCAVNYLDHLHSFPREVSPRNTQ